MIRTYNTSCIPRLWPREEYTQHVLTREAVPATSRAAIAELGGNLSKIRGSLSGDAVRLSAVV
jgi:hypothetical protein